MSALLHAAYDYITLAQVTDYAQSIDANCSIVQDAGRCSGQAALRCTGATGGGPVYGVTTAVSSGWGHVAYKPEAFIVTDTINIITSDGSILMFFRVLADGSVDVWKGPNTTLGTLLGATAAGLVSTNHYFSLGYEFKFDAATGYARIYINQPMGGTPDFASGSVDTTNVWTSGQWRGFEFDPKGYICDVQGGDTAGSAPHNAFMGDIRVEAQLPLTDAVGGNATNRDFTPSTGTDHGAILDANPPTATPYLESGTATQKETSRYPALSIAAGTVYGIQAMPHVVKTAPGGRQIQAINLTGPGVETLGTVVGVAETNYRFYASFFALNTTDVAAVNATQNGVKVSA